MHRGPLRRRRAPRCWRGAPRATAGSAPRTSACAGAAGERLEPQRAAAGEEIEHPRARAARRRGCSSTPRAPGRRWGGRGRPWASRSRRPPSSPATILMRVRRSHPERSEGGMTRVMPLRFAQGDDGSVARPRQPVRPSAQSLAWRLSLPVPLVDLQPERGVHRPVAEPGHPVRPLEADRRQAVAAVVERALEVALPDPRAARRAARRARRRPGSRCRCRTAPGSGRAAPARRSPRAARSRGPPAARVRGPRARACSRAIPPNRSRNASRFSRRMVSPAAIWWPP